MQDSSPSSSSPAPSPSPQPSPSVRINDVAPERSRDFADLMHAALALIITVAVILMAVYLRGFTTGVESDARTASRAFDWLLNMPISVVQQLTTFVIVVSVLAHMLIGREWLQSSIAVIALFGGYVAIRVLSLALSHFGGMALIAPFASPGTTMGGSGLLPDIYAGIGAFLTVAGPRRLRSTVRWSWNILYAVAVVLVILSWHSLSGALASFAIGRLVGMLLRFAAGTQNKGEWGQEIVDSLRNINLRLVSLTRRQSDKGDAGVLQTSLDDDLIENSRIYDAVDDAGERYIVSVLDAQTHSAGYFNQLWQWLRLTGVPMRRDRSTTDANHHHLAMILGLAHLGLSTPKAYGVTDSEESSLFVFQAEGVAQPCDPDSLSDEDAVAAMRYLRTANNRGYTHRRITPESLARTGEGAIVLAGWHNGDCASSGANVALDKVQLLSLLASLIGVERTVAAARSAWGDDMLIALTPFLQKVAVPYATRALPGWSKQLLGEMRTAVNALAPEDRTENAEPVTLSRFSLRSFIVIAMAVVAVAVILTQLQPDEVINAVRRAKIGLAFLCFACSILAWVGASISLGAFMDKDKRHPFALFCSQAASGFTAVSMPAGVGPAVVNLQYLRKSGYRSAAATAIMSATWLVQALSTIVLVLGIGLFTGRNTLSGMIPGPTLIVVIGIAALAFCAAMVIAPLRRLLVVKYLPIIKAYARQLVDVISQPTKMLVCVLGSLVLNITTGLGFWAALLAFGHPTNPMETIFIFLLANTLGSAVPTPGGLGAVEAALLFAFSSVGVPSAVALSATLLYRVCFYWLRIPFGALAMKWLDRRNLI
ncbi:lysylphosphatidylglycerol synthase transmembrane domain-containing protein [Bifidobacterium subtile]|uniref:lysylphosphatidylglycerol synthase transmembrane domain-containing protein n=1 Tax=Bifidobacterium subtile TaxID=77635 RepID=UPI0039C880DB